MKTAIATASAVLVAISGIATAETPPAAPDVGITILAPEGVMPGSTFELGVEFDIEAEWHIYWKNPGDAGLPTEIEIAGPEGVTTGDVRWPIPSRFASADGTVGYGYAHRATLWRPVTVPDNFRPGDTLTLDVNVDWLACKLRCIPGSATRTVTIPIVASTEESFGPEVTGYPDAESAAPFDVRATTGVAGRRTLALSWKNTAPEVEWFPAPPNPYWIEDIYTNSTERETTITYKLRSSGRPSPVREMETIVVITEADGNRRGFTVMVPIT